MYVEMLDTQIMERLCTGEVLRTFCHLYPLPRPIFAAGANGSWVRGVTYAKNGCQVATIADDGFIRFWNLLDETVDPVAIAPGEEEMVCCSFAPSGRVLAVGYAQGWISSLMDSLMKMKTSAVKPKNRNHPE